MDTRTDERTHYEAMGDVSYNCRYYLMQQRLFAKLAGLFRFVSILSGSAAFAGVISSEPKLAGIAALVTSITTALDLIIDPAKKAYTCNEVHRRYREIDRQASKLSLKALEDKLAELRGFEAPTIEALRKPAYNGSCEERGRPESKLKVTVWEKFMAKLA